MEPLHSIRKRVSSVKQTQRSVTDGTSTAYISEKTTLKAGLHKAEAALKALKEDHKAWQKVLENERSLCNMLRDGEDTSLQKMLHNSSNRLDDATEALARESDVHRKCLAVVTDFINEGHVVIKSMKEVEGLLAERRRYEGKLERLVKKTGKASETKEGKDGDKVERNVGKLGNAREAFEKAEREAIDKGKKLNERFDEVVEAVVTAFWGRRVSVLSEFGKASEDLMQWASKRTEEEKA